jgi:hypothetical protein
VLLPGGEHFGPLEQPELLTENILKFIAMDITVPNWAAVGEVNYGTTAG